MGLCQSKQSAKKQLRPPKFNTRSETNILSQSRNKESVSRPRTLPTLPNLTKERLPSQKTQIIQRTRVKAIKDNLYKQYTVLNSQFGYTNYDSCGKLQHNITGQVRIAINIPKFDSSIEKYDQFITNMTENTMTSPHIALINEIYQDTKNYYAIQQYCSGGLLSGLCGKINEEEAIYIASQILDAMSNIHKQESCHGNLNIKNFALYDDSSNHYVKLIDIMPIFLIKDKNDLKQLQINDIKAVGLIIFQLITNKSITPQTAEMICKKPKDLPTKTEWYQLVVQLLECRNLNIYEKVLNNKQYCSIVQRQQARYVETILKKSSKKATYLQQKILLYMNQQYFQDRQKQIENIFKMNDANNNGTLSKKELKTALGGEEDIDELFELLDNDGNGEIDVNEFIFHSCDRRALLTEFNLSATFQLLQKKGFLTAPTLSKILDCDEEQIENEINQIDGSNNLNQEQFIKLMMQLL